MEFDIFLSSNETEEKVIDSVIDLDKYPYFRLANDDDVWKTSVQYTSSLREKFDKLIVVGIGGSSLGAKTLCHYFRSDNDKVEFWDSIDPHFIQTRFEKIKDLEKVHWLFVSKSGGTLETLEVLNNVEGLYPKEKRRQFFSVITENKDSHLKNYADVNNLQCFDHPLDVGGRFSVLSIVGLMPLAFLIGDELLTEQIKAKNWEPTTDLRAFANMMLNSFERGEWIGVIWPYDEKLKYLGYWAQQLWAESLGKKIRNDGEPAPKVSSPSVLHGSKDQHSVLQQLVEGQKDKLLFFFDDKSIPEDPYSLFTIMKKKTPESLRGNVSYIEFKADNIWDFLLSFQYWVIALGEKLNINVFDQPGVEDSKVLFKNAISTIDKLSPLLKR